MVTGFNEIPGLRINIVPNGAFYVFVDATDIISRCPKALSMEIIDDDTSLARFLLEEAKVAVVPGSAFGGPGYLRLSYATSEDRIREGLRRIKEAVSRLG
jgi:aspartate aminotransferase